MNLQIEIVPQLDDNYSFVITDPRVYTGETAARLAIVVDPSDPAPLTKRLDRLGVTGGFILNTHHHADHTAGNLELKNRYGFEILASAADRTRIPGVDRGVDEGDEFELLNTRVQCFSSPGHTRSHLVFYLSESGDVFTGDTLFLLGCGRIFEGNASELYSSLQRLARLPDATRIWCGHEYTLRNLDFAIHVLGADDPALNILATRYRQTRNAGQPTLPGILGEERAANPFFRCEESGLKQRLGLPVTTPAVEVFTLLRQMRNQF